MVKSKILSFFGKKRNAENMQYRPAAGIEAVRIDGELHFYGYSHSEDSVMSPLFANAEQMANFATANLSQMDGEHEQKYWLELASYAAEESELFEDVCEITTKDMELLNDLLNQAESTGKIQKNIPELSFVENVVLELQHENLKEEVFIEYIPLAKQLGLDEICGLISHISGQETHFKGSDIRGSAKLVRIFIQQILKQSDDSWHNIFSTLVTKDT